MNFLLMGDLHTVTKDIKETESTYKLENFILNIIRTNKSLIRDTKDYKIPLIALRNSPYLIGCRYHNIKKYKNSYCKFQNVRYHSWDLRFTNVETDLTILSELTMTYDYTIYNYFEEYGINGKILTQFLITQPIYKS